MMVQANFVGFICLVIPYHTVLSNWITPQLNLFRFCCKLLNKPKVTTWDLIYVQLHMCFCSYSYMHFQKLECIWFMYGLEAHSLI